MDLLNAAEAADGNLRVADVSYALNKCNVPIPDYSDAVIQVRNVTDQIRDPKVFSSLLTLDPMIYKAPVCFYRSCCAFQIVFADSLDMLHVGFYIWMMMMSVSISQRFLTCHF